MRLAVWSKNAYFSYKTSKKYLFFTKTSKKYAKTLDKLSQKCYTSFVSELDSLQALVLQAFESSYKN